MSNVIIMCVTAFIIGYCVGKLYRALQDCRVTVIDENGDELTNDDIHELANIARLEEMCRECVKENSQKKYSNDGLQLQFLTGQVMKKSLGKANPMIVIKLLKDILEEQKEVKE